MENDERHGGRPEIGHDLRPSEGSPAFTDRCCELEFLLDPPVSFAGGRSFGTVGPYVRIKGRVRGEVDPDDPRNSGIVDLAHAARNARGLVSYEADLFVLRPADMARSAGLLLHEIPNRGRKFLPHWLQGAGDLPQAYANDPSAAADMGNGFCLGRGYSLAWVGWEAGAPRTEGGMAIDAPLVLDGGKPVVGWTRHEIVAGTRDAGIGETVTLAYPVANSYGARLMVKDQPGGEEHEIASEHWALTDATTLRLDGGFARDRLYEFCYQASDARVLGIGFCATRDVASALRDPQRARCDNSHPFHYVAGPPPIRHAMALGISQSGRFLRHLLDLGMNRDTRGRAVFDGVFCHIAGAGKTFANHRWGMPGRTATQFEDHRYPEFWFPFSTAPTASPVTGESRSLVADAEPPKIMELNTSTEYWQKGASLVHMSPIDGGDISLPANARAYFIAGAAHHGRAGLHGDPGPCRNPRNTLNPAPALRALLAALEAWIVEGTEPPPSQVPRRADGTAIAAEDLKFPQVRGIHWPRRANAIEELVDWLVPTVRTTFPRFVPALDGDGNELSGIRLPPVEVPAATFSGANLFRGIAGQLCDREGSTVPFAKTAFQQDLAQDPRLSLDRRYLSQANYLRRVKSCCRKLVERRLLLEADAASYLARAQKGYMFE